MNIISWLHFSWATLYNLTLLHAVSPIGCVTDRQTNVANDTKCMYSVLLQLLCIYTNV